MNNYEIKNNLITYERHNLKIKMMYIFTDLFQQNHLRITKFSCIEIKVMKFCQFPRNGARNNLKLHARISIISE